MRHRHLSKSFLDDYDACGRYGYLSRFFLGRGIERTGQDHPEKSVGSAVHHGVETVFNTGSLKGGIGEAWKLYEVESLVAFEGVPSAVADPIRQEYARLIQQVITLWYKVQYPKLLSEYDVVQVEKRGYVKLTEDLTLIAQPDAILKSKFDGRFYDHSLKTAKSYGRIKHPQALIDTQGLTETVIMAMTVAGGELVNVGGVLMEYLVVGSMDKNELIIWSPLMQGWCRPRLNAQEGGDETMGMEYAWRWEFPNPGYNPDGPKSPSKNPKNTTLTNKSKDDPKWTRISAFDYPGGPEQWIDDLLACRFTPHHINPTSELIYAPGPYYRQNGQIESFLAETIAQQTVVSQQLAAMEAGQMPIDSAYMFKRNRGHCVKYGEDYRCQFWNICWEGAGADPLNTGYRVRKPSPVPNPIERT